MNNIRIIKVTGCHDSNKEYTTNERLMHDFILQYLIVCANPNDTSAIIDINPKEYYVI